MKPRVANQKTAALTLLEVLVVILVLFVLVALLLPKLARSGPSRRGMCINNLKQIGLASLVWAGDHDGKFPMQVSVTNWGAKELALQGDVAGIFRAMSNELYTPRILWCPTDKDHVMATNFAAGFSTKNISYFVGLDAATNHPQTILSGDDNFVIDNIRIRPGLLTLSTVAPSVWTASLSASWGARSLRFPTNALVVWSDTRHINSGNVVAGDGSVAMTRSFDLQRTLVQNSVATNRLAIP